MLWALDHPWRVLAVSAVIAAITGVLVATEVIASYWLGVVPILMVLVAFTVELVRSPTPHSPQHPVHR